MTPGQPLLAAAMIVRDEAAHLGACLSSIAPVVDEIVVVDTGSSDDSVAIAESFGARVIHHPWDDDFSAARNVALDAVRAQWVLYIDADERLRPVDRADVVALLDAADEVAFRVRLRPFVGALPAYEYRLWRSDPRIRFVGIIHEKVVPAIAAVADTDGRPIGLCELELDHVGYEGDQSSKHARNLPLLRAQLAAEPRNVFNWHHLATVLAAHGEADEAEDALERARELVQETDGEVPPAGVLVYADLVALRRGRVDVADLLAEGLRAYPDAPPLLWAQAVSLVDAGEYDEALAWLDLLEATDVDGLDPTVSYEAGLFGGRVQHARAVAAFGLGRYRDAADAFTAAERHDPDPELRLQRILAERLAGGAASTRVVDLGGVAVALRGVDAARAEDIATVCRWFPTHDGPPQVDIELGDARCELPDRPWDLADGDIRAWWEPDALYLVHGETTARVGERAATIGSTQGVRRAFRQLLPYVLTQLLAPEGRYVLHGGGIHIDGQAVLVLGGTGAGKSTLVASALRAGWGALGDDLVILRADPAGPSVGGVAKPITVPADVALAGPHRVRAVPGDPRGRWALPPAATDLAWRPVASTIVTGHGADAAADLRRLPGRAISERLLHSFLARYDPDRLRAFLPLAAQTAQRGGWELLHGTDVDARVASAGTRLHTVRAALRGGSETAEGPER